MLATVAYHEETRELRGERDNARNNAGCMQATKTWMDNIKTWTGLSVEVSQNDRGLRSMEKRKYSVRPRCGQPSDRGLLK